LDEAGGRAAVAARGVVVVALLAADDHPVAAQRNAALAGDAAFVPGPDGAGIVAAVGVVHVAVVAGLVGGELAVAAHGGAGARGPRREAGAVRFELTVGGAAVSARPVVIVAALVVLPVEDAVAARQGDDRSVGQGGGT